MAIEALKSAGIKAYQGSSPKPVVISTQPETPVAVKNVKTAEKAVEVVQTKPDKGTEAKPETKKVDFAVKKGDDGGRVQEKPVAKETVRMPEPILPENKAVFGVHESTNRVTIKIVDKKTKEVLKEYPPEKTLDMIAKVWELAGLLVDEKR